MLDDLLVRLEATLADRGSPTFVDRFEEVVEDISHIDDPVSIEALMAFMDDSLDDSLVFSLVHTIERFDDETYVEHLLAGLPELAAHSPEWAATLVRRVHNAPHARAALEARLASADPELGELVQRLRRAD